MTTVERHIEGFKKLGDYLRNIDKENTQYQALFDCIQNAKHHNGWFTETSCLQALKSWGELLSPASLEQWISAYTWEERPQKRLGLILAGNIPLVGFHDVICTLLCGHRAQIKLSSSDPLLIPFLVKKLEELDPVFSDRIAFTQNRLDHFDAVIATGSNNAARYFEHYFAKVPCLIRKNRNGIAVLNGTETEEELAGFAKDVMQYYGLGCRSTAKVYLPKGYDLNLIFGALYPYSFVTESEKYCNNYDYNKAVFLMSEFELLDNGFFLLREESSFSSPIGCLHYEYYESEEKLKLHLEDQAENIQCVSTKLEHLSAIGLGQAQQPLLWDYADNVDTVKFLQQL